jgi:hypothetical protein
MKSPKGSSVFWALWLLAFGFYEGQAIFNAAEGDTFSEFWWILFKTNTDIPLWWSIVSRVAVAGFGVWLIGHLGFGLWGGPRKWDWGWLTGKHKGPYQSFKGDNVPPDDITKIIGESVAEVGPLVEDVEGYPKCPGCGRYLLLMDGHPKDWVHTYDFTPMCSLDRAGFLTGMNGHRWRDTDQFSECANCGALFGGWRGSQCQKAPLGTDYRL